MAENHVVKTAMPGTVWVLGFVSLLMDVSSEMIHGLLPAFLATVLGAGPVLIGAVEGLAEATSLLAKIVSGTLSDRMRRRKIWVVWGYGLGAVSKPFIALAGSVPLLAAARFVDRMGKGFRGAPRDALLADVTPPEIRGAAFGLRQSLDTVGAVIGPLLGLGLMVLWKNDFRKVFWMAALPGFMAVLLLWVGVREPAEKTPRPAAKIDWRLLRRLGGAYWSVVALGALMMMARFSEAFLILRGKNEGVPVEYTPLVLVLLNVVYALTAYPMGKLGDRLNKHRLLLLGLLMLVVAALLLAWGKNYWILGLGVGVWGLHLGMTQGLLSALVAETSPTEWRGTAFGFFNFVSGLAMLLSNLLAGAIWQKAGPAWTFGTSAAFALTTAVWLKSRVDRQTAVN